MGLLNQDEQTLVRYDESSFHQGSYCRGSVSQNSQGLFSKLREDFIREGKSVRGKHLLERRRLLDKYTI